MKSDRSIREPNITSIEDKSESDDKLQSIRKPELDNGDYEEIENEIDLAASAFKKSLENKDIENEGLAIPILFSVLLVLFLLEICRVVTISNVTVVASGLFNSNQEYYEIKELSDIDVYMRERVLFGIFNNYDDHPYLYQAGLKLTMNRANLIRIPYKNYKFPNYISEPYDYEQLGDTINKKTSKYGISEYDSNSKTAAGYTEYFIDMTYQESIIKWRELNKMWIDSESFISLEIEVMSHCRNTYTTVFFYKSITRKSSSKLIQEDYSLGISPELYSDSTEEFTSIIIIFTVLMILYIIVLLKFIKRYFMVCKRLITKFTLSLNLYDFLELILIFCLTAGISLYLKLDLANIGKFSLPIDEKSFEGLLEYSFEHRTLIRVSSLTCLFSLFRLVALMKFQFPAFGVLFETIKLSKNDVFNICFISTILYCGFVISIHIAFGTQEESFSTLSKSALEYFNTLVGNVNFYYCDQEECSIHTIITLLFVILFYFILTNLFYAVIISTFFKIKLKDRLLIAAKTKIITDRTKEFIGLLLNFIRFDNKQNLYKEAKEYLNIIELSDSWNFNDNRDKMANIENFIKGQMGISFVQKIKFNLSSLKSFLYNTTLINQDILIEKFKTKMRDILVREKTEEKIFILKEFDVEYNFRLIRGLFCYFFLVIFFLVTTISFLSLKHSFQISEVNIKYVDSVISNCKSFESLSEIKTVNHIYEASEAIILSLLLDQYNSQNHLEFNKTIRLTTQIYSFKDNRSSFSKKVLDKIISGLNFTYFRGNISKLLYFEYESGSLETYRSQGGLSQLFNDYNQTKIIFKFIRVDKLFAFSKCIAIEWVTYNVNLDFLSYNLMMFTIGPEELVKASFKSVSISPEFFNDDDESMIVLIVFSIVLCCYFFVVNLFDLVQLWKEINSKRLRRIQKNYRLDKVIKDICGSQERSINSASALYTIAYIKNKINSIITHIIQLFKVLFNYFFLSPFNSIEAASIILTFVTLISLLYIKIYKFEITSITDISLAADYVEYLRSIVAINSMIILFQFPTYLQISSRISYLIRVMMNARLDFIFFTIMFFIILFGYVFSGYILLGHYHDGFSTIPDAFFSSYFMQFGEYDKEKFRNADNILGLPFIVIYILVIIFFLTTMFTAIISGSYSDKGKFYKMSTYEKVKRTINARLKGEKVIVFNEIQEFEFEEADSKAIDRIVATTINDDTPFMEPVKKAYFTSNHFYSALETRLKQSHIKIIIYQPNRIYKIQYSDPTLLSFLNLQMWHQSALQEKIKLWNGLSLQFRNQVSSKTEGIFKVYGLELKNDYSDIQKDIWNSMDINEKLEMWNGQLSDDGRVDVWNIEEFSKELTDSWDSLGIREKIEKAKKFLTDDGDKKVLWKSLGRVSNVKLNLLLSLKDKIQYELIMCLCILDAIDSPIFIDMLDNNLEDLLDDKIFLSKQKSCIYLGELSKYNHLKDITVSLISECESMINYRKYISDELSRLKHFYKRQNKRKILKS